MTDASRVLVALRLPAAAERAFAAFTEQISEWWQPNGLFQFTEGRTGTLAFEPAPDGRLVETYNDGESFVVGHIRAWDHPIASCSPGVTPASPPTRRPSCTYGSTTSTTPDNFSQLSELPASVDRDGFVAPEEATHPWRSTKCVSVLPVF